MSSGQIELQRMGQLVYPEITGFAEVIAVFHRGDDIIFKITPKIPTEIWFETVRKRCYDKGFWVLLHEKDGDYAIVVKDIRPAKRRAPWVNIILAILTIASLTVTYTLYEGHNDFLTNPQVLLPGVWYMLSLMSILAFHEFGHYFAARRHNAAVSLPFFIPVPYPVTLFGTMGAFIKSRTPFKSRKELFDVGVAGPLAGFIPAGLILVLGYYNAEFVRSAKPLEPVIFGDSLFLLGLKAILLPALPSGYELVRNPLIHAGWVGMFVTMMNLLPLGQLDGGHITYALVGKRHHKYIANGFLILLLGLAFIWMGWLFWAALVTFVIKVKHPPTLDDSAPLDRRRLILGWTAVMIFVLTFVPIPLRVIPF